MAVRDRLAHLVPHWIEHNESHAAQLEEWAGKAREAGLPEVADGIAAAGATMRKANERLRAAGERLPQPGQHDPE